jgi:arylsulfatase A-like enzyme
MKLIALLAFIISTQLLAANKPNIIFILTDDQRYDEIGAVGNFPWLVTPNLDKLLKE